MQKDDDVCSSATITTSSYLACFQHCEYVDQEREAVPFITGNSSDSILSSFWSHDWAWSKRWRKIIESFVGSVVFSQGSHPGSCLPLIETPRWLGNPSVRSKISGKKVISIVLTKLSFTSVDTSCAGLEKRDILHCLCPRALEELTSLSQNLKDEGLLGI